ncbi:Asp23/Gls24 family envelope stress response protein [Gordonia paraffinivorans]|uniref:Asp23/Gls24 family envelope stress response protein n=1 Tax=Gordonia paraffinivorans TaxID=175628 RepID=A0ABD7V0U9_9ACTN|nr:Asp23/Gls24 family envelope stress response protein [Gordonia paraffinivorans]MCD2143993.1 Asp23/Gls24 family envelope stress response protein [Gordonia paraffinivorans]VFA83015.1 Uncharacterised protein [Gordonia paraffinivorans]
MTPADLPDARPDHQPKRELVDEVAEAVLAVPGVTGLHGGLLGEVATYLPGRRVAGIALDDEAGEIHIVADLTHDLRSVAATVRDTAEQLAGRTFTVIVEDITTDPTPNTERR